MKPIVDANLCIGCGTCASLCPEVFQIGDDGKAHVIGDNFIDKKEAIQEEAKACPVSAISVAE